MAPLKQALGSRGGVVREQDGFEVFYGTKPKPAKAKQDSRDGFDIFYGIQSRDRAVNRAAAPAERAGPDPGAAAATAALAAAAALLAGDAVATNSGTAEDEVVAQEGQQRLGGSGTGGPGDAAAADRTTAAASAQNEQETTACTEAATEAAPFEAPADSPRRGAAKDGYAPASPLASSTRSVIGDLRGVETYSMCGRSPPPVTIPSSVASYSMATPQASFVPPTEQPPEQPGSQQPQQAALGPARKLAPAVPPIPGVAAAAATGMAPPALSTPGGQWRLQGSPPPSTSAGAQPTQSGPVAVTSWRYLQASPASPAAMLPRPVQPATVSGQYRLA